jgi:hypothetical protein
MAITPEPVPTAAPASPPAGPVGNTAPPRQDEALAAYVRRQAATVGRAGTAAPAWVPRLPQADGACLGMIEGFGGINACGIAMSADGERLFTGHPHGRVRCWDLRTGARLWEAAERHRRGIQDLAIARDDRFLASCSDDGTIRLWDATTGAALACFEGHTGTVWSVRIAPDGQRVISGARDGTARLWDLATGRELRCLAGHEQPVWSATFSPDGRRIATGSADRSVRLWDVDSGDEIGRMDGHEDTVWSVTYSPDGRLIASGSADRSVRLWDADTLQPVARLLGHEHGISSVAFSPDGNYLASSSSDRSVRLWDARTGQQRAAFQAPEDYAWRVAWAPSGAFVASTHHRDIVRLWDTRSVIPAGVAAGPGTAALPPGLAVLPGALAAALRAGFAVPLSLVRDLLALTGGADEPEAGALAGALAGAQAGALAGALAGAQAGALAHGPGMRALARLGWPPDARVALVLVVLALARLPGAPVASNDLALPAGVTPAEVQLGLAEALAGPEIPATAPPVPVAALRLGLDRVDDRVTTLLASVGAAACARDPSLPLMLLERLSDIVPLRAPERELLGRRLPTELLGQTEGAGFGPVRQGITHRGELRALLPSGWALPPRLRAYRHLRGELLYRARAGREPPRLRPVVLVLDASPACVGAVARTARAAAHVMARTLIDARVPGFAIAAGGANTLRALQHAVDAFELLVARSPAAVDVERTLAQARALCESLRDTARGPLAPPIILLVSHGDFGAEVEIGGAVTPHLRALFVQYPGHGGSPPWRHACERWESVPADQPGQVTRALARLLS